MNLTIERTPALAALGRAVGIVARKQIIPILGNVALLAEEGRLTIRATDQEMEVVETIEANVETPGDNTVPADKLHDIVRNADTGAQVKILTEPKDPRVKVRSGRSNYALPALPASGFPIFNGDGLGEEFPISATLLADMLTRVRWMAEGSSGDDVRSGVYLTTVDGKFHCVAASKDGVIRVAEDAPEAARLACVMPMKLVTQLIRWLTDAEGDVQVSAADWPTGDRSDEWVLQRMLRVRHSSGQITAKLFDAPKFVDYMRVMIASHELTAITDQDALATAVRRVLIMQDGKRAALRFSFAPGSITIQARNDQSGEGVEEIGAEYDGPEATVMLSPTVLQEILGAMRGDQVKLSFASAPKDRDALSVKVLIEAPADPTLSVTLAQPRA